MNAVLICNILLGLPLSWSLPFRPIDSRDGSSDLKSLEDGEYGDYFEGDIILLPKPDFAPRNGLRGADFRWPNNTLYYKMSTNHTQEQQNIILKAMDILQSVSCVKFKPQTNQTGYVQFVKNDACSSSVGYQNKEQPIELSDTCFGTGGGSVLHEILHSLGFTHMHNSFNRDKYVKIINENIKPKNIKDFQRREDTTHFELEYDYRSIMHYAKDTYTNNHNLTILPVDEKYIDIIGQRKFLSKLDIMRLNRMYQCEQSSEGVADVNISEWKPSK